MASKIFPNMFHKTFPQKGQFWATEAVRMEIPETIIPSSFNEAENNSKTCIASLYLPLVKYLRAIGFCPFTIKQNPADTKYVLYEFKWRSWLTFYSLCLCGVTSYLSMYLVIYLIWVGFGSEFREVLEFQGIHIDERQLSRNISFVSELGTRFVPVTFPLFSFIAITGAATFLPGFLHLLNSLSRFQQEYENAAFPHRRNDNPFGNLGKYRNSTFMIFPALGVGAIITVTAIIQDCASWKGCLFPHSFIGLPVVVAFFTMLLLLGSHAVHFVVFRTLREVFMQIGMGIQTWGECQDQGIWQRGRNDGLFKKAVTSYKKTLYENMKKWTQIVILAKDLVKITGKALAIQHVLMIFINFLYLCLGVFSCLSAKLGATEAGSRGYVLLLFCTWGFSILISKALACEQILEQEKLIVVQLRKLEYMEHVPSLIQLNLLIDCINEDPAEIRFWGVLTLNKSFLLKLIGQVATYLIVLIQFDNIERGQYIPY